ncbi:MAG: hypothetical protein NTY47_00145, partial [Candidatus Omnitrophica bacterium]|nr:hypothetical protein [Candidatus Omnitrophota bacterium]
VTIIAVIGGVISLLMNSIIDTWSYTQNRLELQKASSEIMDELIQGGFEATGIRDAADFISCGSDSMTFLPLWVDNTHKPDPVGNKEQKFTLNRQFKVGSSIPLAQIKKPDSTEWETVTVKFTYGSSNDPRRLDDVVQIIDPVPYNSLIKFTFTPEPSADPDTQKSFTWNPENRHIYSFYKGETKDLLAKMQDIKVERLRFTYFDNLNQETAAPSGGYLSKERAKRASAVKVYMLLAKKGDWRECASYVNVRNTQDVGVSIIEGSVIPIPSSTRIKALSIGNFYGRKRDGIVRLVIKPETCKQWGLQLRIVEDKTNPGRLIVERFQMESPLGRVLTSGQIDQSFNDFEFVNLLTMDRTGLYDYDKDNGVQDFYECEEDPVFLEVERLDFEGATLFVRP